MAVDNAAALDLALARLKAAVENPEEVQPAVTKYPVTRSLPFMISFFVALALVGVLLGRC